MAETTDDRLEAELECWALGVKMLAQFVREAKERGDVFEQTLVTETKACDYAKVRW